MKITVTFEIELVVDKTTSHAVKDIIKDIGSNLKTNLPNVYVDDYEIKSSELITI